MRTVKSLKLAALLVVLVGLSPEALVARGGGWGAGLGIGLGTGLVFGGLAAAAASRDRNVYVIDEQPSKIIYREQPEYIEEEIETDSEQDADDDNNDDDAVDKDDGIDDTDDNEKIGSGPGNDIVVNEEVTEA